MGGRGIFLPANSDRNFLNLTRPPRHVSYGDAGGRGPQTAQKATSTVGLLALRAAAFGRTQPHPRRRFRTRRLAPFPPTVPIASIPLRATKRRTLTSQQC